MRRISIFALTVVSGFTILAGFAQADTITFHDGREPLECRVLEDFPDSDTILVAINHTDTIKVEEKILRSEVKEITKVPPEKMDYDELQKKVWPTPDMLTEEDYQERLDLLTPYVAKYPTSKYVDEVKKLAELLSAEKEQVESGGLKLDGEWIDWEERAKQRYNVDARILFWKMKHHVKSNQEYEALRVFDRLETEYQDSIIFPEAILLAREILPKMEVELQKMTVRNPMLVEERMAGLKKLETSEVEHQRTKEAIDAERREFDQAIEREKVAKTKWTTYYAYDLDSLESALELVRKEENRLLDYNVAKLRTTANLTSRVRDFLYIKDLDKATAVLDEALAEGGDKKTLGALKKEIDRLRKEATEGVPTTPPTVTPPKDPEVKPPSTDPTGDLLNGIESPAAKASRERQEEKERAQEEERKKAEAEAEAAAAVKPPSDPTPDTGTPETPTVPEGGTPVETPETPATPGATEDPKEGDPDTSNDPVKPADAPKSAPVKKGTQPTAAGGGLPTWNYIMIGVAAVLLVVTVIAKVKQKKKGGEAPVDAGE